MDALFAGDELGFKFSILTSVPSAFFSVTVTFGRIGGTNVEELTLSREVVVEGVGGGEEMLLMLVEGCVMGGGGCG